MKWKIEDIQIANQVVIAPMAGIGNVAFRRICKQNQAGLIYSEMVSDKALIYENEKTFEMLQVEEDEQPVTMQIFGSEADTLSEAAKIVEKQCHAQIIDINLGCPVSKVVKAEAGSKLLLNPDKIYEIVSRVSEAVKKPVTVKMRTGWDQHSINAVEVALKCEKAGAKAIAIHGRTRSQMYEGHADWNMIKDVKQAIKTIPVIGNGDVKTPMDAKRMLDETGVDAVMMGRAVLGNPWLIHQVVTYLEQGILINEPTAEIKIQQAFAHLDSLIALKGEKIAVLEMRSHIPWYIKGMYEATSLKRKIHTIGNSRDIKLALKEYLEFINNFENK